MSSHIRWWKTYDLNTKRGLMEENYRGHGEFIYRSEAEDKIRALQRELDEYKQRDARQYDAYIRNKEIP